MTPSSDTNSVTMILPMPALLSPWRPRSSFEVHHRRASYGCRRGLRLVQKRQLLMASDDLDRRLADPPRALIESGRHSTSSVSRPSAASVSVVASTLPSRRCRVAEARLELAQRVLR